MKNNLDNFKHGPLFKDAAVWSCSCSECFISLSVTDVRFLLLKWLKESFRLIETFQNCSHSLSLVLLCSQADGLFKPLTESIPAEAQEWTEPAGPPEVSRPTASQWKRWETTEEVCPAVRDKNNQITAETGLPAGQGDPQTQGIMGTLSVVSRLGLFSDLKFSGQTQRCDHEALQLFWFNSFNHIYVLINKYIKSVIL